MGRTSIHRDDRYHTYLALGVTLLLGVAFVNQTSFLYNQGRRDRAGRRSSPSSPSAAHLAMVVAGMVFIALMGFRTLGGQFSSRQPTASAPPPSSGTQRSPSTSSSGSPSTYRSELSSPAVRNTSSPVAVGPRPRFGFLTVPPRSRLASWWRPRRRSAQLRLEGLGRRPGRLLGPDGLRRDRRARRLHLGVPRRFPEALAELQGATVERARSPAPGSTCGSSPPRA